MACFSELIQTAWRQLNEKTIGTREYWQIALQNLSALKSMEPLISRYCRGSVLDVGAGKLAWKQILIPHVTRYYSADRFFETANLDMLFDAAHLAVLDQEERRKVVDAFIRACLLALPGARKNSMNANTLPAFVLGSVKEKGQPIQLINAFERPVWAKNGLVEKSIDALKEHHEGLKTTWGIETKAEVAIPEVTMSEFCAEILRHV